MKIRTGLLVASLLFAAMIKPVDAEITKTALPNQPSERVKNLEEILHKSGLCDGFPIVVKVLDDHTAKIATYADRKLSDKEIKLLVLQMSQLVLNNVNDLITIKIRIYDRASTKYWKDITLSTSQIRNGLTSSPEQEQTLDSINIVNNFGLVDGPNLDSRISLYKHIIKLKYAGINVQPFLEKLADIEKAEKNKQNINKQLSELDVSLLKADPVEQPISSAMKTTDKVVQAQESFQEASDTAQAAMQKVQGIEQAQNDMALPEAYDFDSRARYEDQYQALQKQIEAALAELHEARQHRDLAYIQLMQAKAHE